MALIEAIGVASSQGANAHRQRQRIGFFKDLRKDCGPDSFSLVAGADIEMVEQQLTVGRFDNHKTQAPAVDRHVSCMHCRKTGAESFPCANRVEAADAFQAFAHGVYAQCDQFFKVRFGCLDQGDKWCV